MAVLNPVYPEIGGAKVLSFLHQEIAKIIPINGISKNPDNTIEVFYVTHPNDEQLKKINELIKKYPLEEIKLEKLKKIEKEWQQLEATGWNCGQGYLGLSASDVALYSGAFALAKEAAALGLPIPPIITKEDNQINFSTIQEMTALLLQYGAARSLMSAEFAARRRAVYEATTAEQLESI